MKHCRPQFEELEQRAVLSTVTIQTRLVVETFVETVFVPEVRQGQPPVFVPVKRTLAVPVTATIISGAYGGTYILEHAHVVDTEPNFQVVLDLNAVQTVHPDSSSESTRVVQEHLTPRGGSGVPDFQSVESFHQTTDANGQTTSTQTTVTTLNGQTTVTTGQPPGPF